MNGIFGDIFGFDGDGRLDCLEQAAGLGLLAYIMEEEDRSREDYDEDDDEETDADEDDDDDEVDDDY